MRLAGMVVAVVVAFGVAVGTARADDKAFKPYAGRLVYSPDTPPTQLTEIPKFLQLNATKDNAYDVIKGPPWPMNLVAVLAKDPGKKQVQLVFADKADKKLTPIHAVDLQSKKKLVIARTEATIAAGFATGKTYVVRVMLGKTVLAKAEITLKD